MATWSLVVAVGCHLAFVAAQYRWPAVSSHLILAAAGLLVLVAIAVPPAVSKDVWSYAMYGRIAGVHHVSAYTHPPDAFPRDPMLARVNPRFVDTPLVYGPGFSELAGLGARWYQGSPLLARLYFQALAGGALLGSVALLVRRGTAVWVVALVALAPGVLQGVNAAHLDLLVGFLILAGLLLLDDERYEVGALVVAMAVLIKIVAVPALAGAFIALVLRRRFRAAFTVAGVSGAVVGVAYLLVGGLSALGPLSQASHYVSSASIGRLFYQGGRSLGGRPKVLIDDQSLRSFTALALAGLSFGAFAWRRRSQADLVTFAVGATVVYLLTTNYALAWYPLAILPAAALVGNRLRWCAFGSYLLLFLADGRYLPLRGVDDHMWLFGALASFVLLALIIWRSEMGRSGDRPTDRAPLRAGSTSALARN
ncbi:MAG: glycosyltransferase 87 family protein [Aquihabitans sp.]